jgi:GTP-binding protein EngB required for normal cell division
MTDRAAKMILKKLDKLSGGDEEKQIAMLDKSVVKCWSDVYELTEQYAPSKSRESGQEKADRLLAEMMAEVEG